MPKSGRPVTLKMYYTSEELKTNLEFSLVCSSDLVQCHPGDDVVLSCRLDPPTSAAAMEIKWWKEDDLVCHYKDRQMTMAIDDMDRVRLSSKDLLIGNVSLTLSDVRSSQRGFYKCEVSHKGQTMKKRIFLSTTSEDNNLVVSIGPISADPGTEVNLPVYLSPETSAESMTIRWFKGTELIYVYKNRQREMINNDFDNQMSLSIQELVRGNLSLTLRNVQPSDSGQYTCRVYHDGCVLTGRVHFQVRGWVHRRKNSTEGIRPVLDGESSGQSTIEENTKIRGDQQGTRGGSD